MRLLKLMTLLVAGVLAPTAAQGARSLTLEERTDAMSALQLVEWDLTLWPEQNPGAKPALDRAALAGTMRTQAEDALLKSEALARYWGRPVTPAQLQAEIDRMVRDSKRPEGLRRYFAALGNDPLLIAECLARPHLVDRLARNWYARDEREHGDLHRRIESRVVGRRSRVDLATLGGAYREIELRPGAGDEPSAAAVDTLVVPADSWRRHVVELGQVFGVDAPDRDVETTFAQLPVGRLSSILERDDAFVLRQILGKSRGSLRIATVVFEKVPFDTWWKTARRALGAADLRPLVAQDAQYTIPPIAAPTCVADTWTSTRQDVPDRRYNHTAVWTGAEMIVWGGFNEIYNTDELNTGARYDPATDTWKATSTGANAPTKRMSHSAVWTGSEMIVWGGSYDGGMLLNTGARYNPLTDTWAPIVMSSAVPAARDRHTAVWTGAEMIVWGGVGIYGAVNTGGSYAPATEVWLTVPTTNAPSARYGHAGVWTGSAMIVWGGYSSGPVNTGGRFDPVYGTWTATTTTNAPQARERFTAIWTGSEMIVWGGLYSTTVLNSGGRYSPGNDAWTATSTANAPSVRDAHTAVWTGTQMIVWGGVNWTYPNYNTGGRYTPSTDSWTATSTTNAPAARKAHTALWTGSEMIVWGGTSDDMTNTGGRYAPATDTWTPTSTGADVPAARYWHTAVWTGSKMIVWGGFDDLIELNSGGRYDLATDSWSPTSRGANVPTARRHHTAVWTGTEMIVWGGYPGTGLGLNSGARYDPVGDQWTPTSIGTNLPAGRNDHTAVWTGTEMIVWGGYGAAVVLNTGGRYAPASNSWTATSVGTNVPSARDYHSAVWTGQQMIVWAGETTRGGSSTNTGGRYDPASDSWLPTSMGTNVPGAQSQHVAVWTGNEMVVWGGGTPGGGRYAPGSDSWLPMATTGSPGGRRGATAVWTGTEMIAWGGGQHMNTGGRYNPATNTWIVTSTGPGTPGPRLYHRAVWTGGDDGRMLVWGGEPVTQTGALYCGSSCASTTFYKDIDGDGYGGTLYTTTGCTPPPGYVANGTDCADADANDFPGNTEVCDGWDNDCDYVIDTDAAIPAGVPTLVLWRYGGVVEMSWAVVPGSDRYDLVKGALSALALSAGNYTSAVGVCADNLTTRRIGDTQLPPENDGYWYLVRAENCKGNGSWSEGVASEASGRDAEIGASPNTCP